ncbi:DUF1652 domain-containing protein [Pseudomonas aeruginosa]|uniref:DUF1652 domain-containing protein n=1 Tax=Pseudomonas aeruginosa TaxID=287 RepID=UPI0034587291
MRLTFEQARQLIEPSFSPFTCSCTRDRDGAMSILLGNALTGTIEAFSTGIGTEQWRTPEAVTQLIRDLRLDIAPPSHITSKRIPPKGDSPFRSASHR